MHAVDIITRKRDKLDLTAAEINWFIEAYTAGDLPDYQAAAFLMAVCINGMTAEETAALTLAMAQSGDMLDLGGLVGGYAVDKHSSGGVGDKTSLVVLPLVAACGVPVAKMSGRGLGLSGGTLDKLESIPGFRADLSADEFEQLARDNGLVLAGQSRALAPADGKLYALRDVTGTVPSLPLIASSIMSKKIAVGANGIVLDVKTGSGAFMKSLEEARALAQLMVEIGHTAGRDVVALVSDMNQPLGGAVGNALEVREAVTTLKAGGPADLREHCLTVAAQMLRLAGQGTRWTDVNANAELLAEKLADGSAFDQFRHLVAGQGGDVAVLDDLDLLPATAHVLTVPAAEAGYLAHMDAEMIARAAFELGAGREQKGQTVDLAVGVVVHHKVGDAIAQDEPLVTIHANDQARLAAATEHVHAAIAVQPEQVEPLPLFYDVITHPAAQG
jgi:pyrimidine-nucleoside phosphorylase